MVRHEHDFCGPHSAFVGGSQFDAQDGYPGLELHLRVAQATQSSEWSSEKEADACTVDFPIAKLQFTITDGDDYEPSTLLNLAEIDELITALLAFKQFCAERSVPEGKGRSAGPSSE